MHFLTGHCRSDFGPCAVPGCWLWRAHCVWRCGGGGGTRHRVGSRGHLRWPNRVHPQRKAIPQPTAVGGGRRQMVSPRSPLERLWWCGTCIRAWLCACRHPCAQPVWAGGGTGSRAPPRSIGCGWTAPCNPIDGWRCGVRSGPRVTHDGAARDGGMRSVARRPLGYIAAPA